MTETLQEQIDRLTADLNETRGRLSALEAGDRRITVVHEKKRREIRWVRTTLIIFGLILFVASCVASLADPDSHTRRALDAIEQGQK